MLGIKKDKDKNREKTEELKKDDEQIPENETASIDAEQDKIKLELEEKLKTTEQELESYKDRLLRKAAEFENYKRRTENDQLNLFKYAAESFIAKLLPVIDDFERSLIHIKDAKEVDSIKDGIKLVYDKLMKMLADQGVKPIEAVGKPFDVHFHEAILQRKSDDVEPHTVLEEFEKGYMYKDRVIRHTKVAVSEDPHEDENKPVEEPKEESNNLKAESND